MRIGFNNRFSRYRSTGDKPDLSIPNRFKANPEEAASQTTGYQFPISDFNEPEPPGVRYRRNPPELP
jgi:hypothetical protein